MITITKTSDHRILAELNEEIQTFHHTKHPEIFKRYDKRTIATFFRTVLNDRNAIAYLAIEDENPVGYILLFKRSQPASPFQYAKKYVLIDQVLVLGTHRGNGVGRQLLDASVSFAKRNKIDRLELNHWSVNETARQFFIDSGFERYNERMWRFVD